MERPKPRVKPVERDVTGEIVYLDRMRQFGIDPQVYPGDLPDMAIDVYEIAADMYKSQGARPPIMDEYDKHDMEVPELGASCASLAEVLLTHKRPNSLSSFENFIVAMPPAEVLEALQKMRAGEVLAPDNEQLALSPSGGHYSAADVIKKDAKLTSVGVRAYGWSDGSKYLFTDEPGEQLQGSGNRLSYPSNEESHSYKLEVSFSYQHPKAGYFNERVILSVGQRGTTQISSQVWVAAYADMGYEGHGEKDLKDATEDDIAAFADLIAEMVGDEPEAVWQHNDRKIREYISTVPSEVAREYLLEWVDNKSSLAVYQELARDPTERPATC